MYLALWSAYPPPDELVRDYFLLRGQDGLPLFEAFKDTHIHFTHFVDAPGHHVVVSQVYRLLLRGTTELRVSQAFNRLISSDAFRIIRLDRDPQIVAICSPGLNQGS